ncbi:hypothetical protein PR202_gb23186 [Eleusine coracana subsp. coracana]|uniref:MaoC-like domain-containing protein n=1 Tax=Eleusine coracana subsp. coracana TaxID=191504 RepID=A0AAV5FIA5_ELECO|nr:hypothetical protein PR202_gb23186 [Eleusine coracana subsp. coracana]
MALSASVADPVDNTIINPAMVLSHKYPEVKFEYDERDVALYALTVGACSSDLADEKELQLVYHRDGQSCIKVLPTFVSLFTTKYNNELVLDVPGLHYDPKLLVHGQQYIEIYGPIPSRANVTNKIKVAGLHDRGKAAVLELEILSYLEGSCELLCMNRSSFYLRGAGGFSDSSRPFSYTTYPANEALLCGISSYFDPLHSDPIAAQEAGFSHPILPGLGTLGFVIRTVLRSSNTESTNVKSISCRFLHHVYPGETLVSEMWFRGQR